MIRLHDFFHWINFVAFIIFIGPIHMIHGLSRLLFLADQRSDRVSQLRSKKFKLRHRDNFVSSLKSQVFQFILCDRTK